MSLKQFLLGLRKRILDRRSSHAPRPGGKLRVTKLEERKLLDAGFGIGATGILALDGFGAGDALTLDGGLSSGVAEFTLAPTSGIWNPTDPDLGSGLFTLSNGNRTLTLTDMTGVTGLSVNADVISPLNSVTSSPSGVQFGSLEVINGGSVDLTTLANDFDSISVSAASLDLFDTDSIDITSLSVTGDVAIEVGAGDITDADGASISVGGNAEFTGATITLGNHATDTTNFGSLTFAANGAVDITEDSDMNLTGDNDATSLQLTSSGALTNSAPSSLDVSDTATLDSDSIDLNDNPGKTLNLGSVQFLADGDVNISENDGIHISGDSSTDGHVTLNAGGDLTVDSGVTITGDDVNLTADAVGGDNGDIGSASDALTVNASTLTTFSDGNQYLATNNRIVTGDLDTNGGAGTITLHNGAFFLQAGSTAHGTVTTNGTASLGDLLSVANSNDSGAGSFRQALIDANASADFDLIEFDISAAEGAGPHSIALLSDLPDITGQVMIDGTTDSNFVTAPVIVLSGSSLGNSDGMTLATGSDGSTIRGLALNEFGKFGLRIESDNNTIEGNYIGVDANGVADAGNAGGGIQIADGAASNTIGGSDDASRNLISGNDSEVLRRGTVGFWRGDGDATDGLGNFNGTIGANPTFGTGKVGQGFVFDGSNGGVSTDLLMNYDTGVTYEAWINTSSTVGLIVGGGGGGTASTGIALYVDAGNVRFSGAKGVVGDFAFDVASGVINDGQWHHVAGTWTGGTAVDGVKLYVDGLEVASGSSDVSVTTFNEDDRFLNFGYHSSGFYSAFTGGIDEVSAYSRALSATEISEIAAAGASGKDLAGNTGEGIAFDGGGANNQLLRNLIGTDSSGTSSLSNFGPSTIDNTALFINDTVVADEGIVVSSTGTLAGTGTINAPVTVNGIHAPGNSPGVQTIIGNYELATGSTLQIEIDGTSASMPVEYDQVDVTGSVTLAGTIAVTETIAAAHGTEFTIIHNDGADAVDVTAFGLNEGEVLTGTGGQMFTISFVGGDGNDVTLTALTATTTVSLVSNDLVVDDVQGTSESITISDDGTSITISDAATGAVLSSTVAGTTQAVPESVSILKSSFTGSIIINGGAGDDSLTIDLTNGDVIPADGIEFNGGTGGNDSLHIVGGSQGNATYNYDNANDGNIVLQNFGTVTYTGLEPITNTGTATDIVFNLTAGDDTDAVLSNLGGGTLRLDGSTFEQTDFLAPAANGSITVNLGDGADTLTVDDDLGLALGTDLTVDGKAGADVVNLNGASLSVTGNLSITAETISQTEAASVTGTTTLNAGASGIITLDNVANDFQGALTITNADSATLDDTNAATFAAVTTQGNLIVDAGAAVDFSGVLSVGGNLDVETDANGAGGAITDSTGQVAVTGTTVLDAANNDVTLNNVANDYGGNVSVTGGAVTLTDANALTLDTVSAASLDVSAVGAVIDAAAATVAVTGLVDVTGSTITLGGGTFDAGTLTFNSAGAVVIQEDSATALAGANTALSLDLDSAAAITDSSTSLAVTNLADLAGTAITVGGGGTTTNFGTLTFNSAGAVVIQEDSATALAGANTALSLDLDSAAAITDGSTSLAVTNLADLAGTEITIGGAGTTTNFGTLTFNSAGAVVIQEDSATALAGANTALSLDLDSAAAITDGSTSLAVTNLADLAGTAITVGGAGTTTNFGTLTFNSAGAVVIQEDSATALAGANTALSLDLDSAAAITDGSTSLAVTNLADLAGTAITVGGAGTTTNFGTLTFNSAGAVVIQEDSATALAGASTALSLDLDSAAAITDGSTSLAVTNLADLAGTAITVGGAGTTTNFGTLTFNSAGAVVIQEDSATALAGASTALSLDLDSAAAITDGSTSLAVTNLADLAGTAITVGGAGTTTNFGTLTFNSAGAVVIQEDSATALAGANTALSLDLDSAAAITDGSTSLAVTNLADLAGTAITVGGAGTTTNFGTLTFNSAGAVVIQEDSATALAGANTALSLDLDSAAAITDGSTSLAVTNLADLAGTAITVGGAGTTTNFGTLTFNSAGAVVIQEDSATALAGASTALSLDLDSAAAITDGSTSLAVTNLADLAGTAITVGGAGTTTNFGTLTFNSAGAVVIQEDSATALVGANTALSLDLDSAAAITDGSTSLAVTNLADLAGTAITVGGAGTTTNLGTLTFNSAGAVVIQEDSATALAGANTALSLDLDSAAAITDGSTSLAVTNLADLAGTAITVGGAGTTTNFGTLTFNSAGAVVIQEDSATALVGANTALSLDLDSAAAITDGSTSLAVTNLADLAGTAITVGGAGTTTNLGTLTFNSAGAVVIQEDSATALAGANTALSLDLDSAAAITDGSTSLAVTNLAEFAGTAITVGGAGTTTNFGTLTFNSAGAVIIQEDSATALAGANTALSLDLDSAAAITDSSTSLAVTNLADFSGTAITVGGAGTTTNFGTLTSNSTGVVVVAEDSDMDLVVATGSTVTLSSTGAINDAAADVVTDITATTINLDAVNGIGNAEELELAGTTISADTGQGDIDLDNTVANAADVTSLTTVGGSINFDNNGAAVAFSGTVASGGVGTNGGSISLTSDSGLTIAASGGVDTSIGSGGTLSVSGATLLGGITVGAGSVTIAGSNIDLTIGAAISASDTIQLNAERDVIISGVVDADGASSDIIVTADTNLGVDAGGADHGGVHIQGPGQLDAEGSITIAGSDLSTVAGGANAVLIDVDGAAAVQVLAAGSIDIGPTTNAPATADTTIEGGVQTTGASSTVTITGQDSVNFGAGGDVTAIDDITIVATSGDVAMTDGAVIASDAGDIAITSAHDIQLATVNADADAAGLSGNVELTADSDTNNDGAISDATALDSTANITAASISLRAADGIGSTDDIDITSTAPTVISPTIVAFQNSTGNNVQISNVGALQIDSFDGLTTSFNTAAGGTTTLQATSPITFAVNTSSAGTLTAQAVEDPGPITDFDHITVNAGVTVQSTGANVVFEAGDDVVLVATSTVQAATTIAITAGVADNDLDGDLTINGDITAGSTISLAAFDSISFGADADVATTSGNTTVSAATGNATGTITMTDGATIDGGSGTVDLTADGNVAVSNVTSTNATVTAVAITSNLGAITDAGNADVDIVTSAGRAVLTSASGIGHGDALETTLGSLDASTTSAGAISIVETDSINLFDVDTANGAITVVSGGALTASDVASLTDADANDISLTTTAGLINVTTITAGTLGDVTLDSAAAITDDGSALTKITADVLTADAAGSITLDTMVASADVSTSAAGSIDLDETDAINLTDLDTANGSIVVDAGGAITASDVASLMDSDTNDIALTTTAGLINVVTISAGTLGDVTLNSAAAITDDGSALTMITADVLTADAAGAITLDTMVASADVSTSAPGDIDIDETDAVILTDVDSADGSITVDAGGTITATDVDANGTGADATLTATVGDITATLVTADDQVSLDSDAGNIFLGSVMAATTATVTADVGAVNDAAADVIIDITASTIDVNAATGIGNNAALELAGTSLSIDNTASGNVDVDNTVAAATNVSTLTTAGGGTILFENTGAGGVSFGVVSSASDASPSVGEDDITLSSDGGSLTVTTSVTANGMGDVVLNTTNSGNVVVTGTITAADDQITVNSVGAINGGGLVTADTANLNAATGIGDSLALQLAVDNISADTTTGDIDIDNALTMDVTVSSLSTDGGNIDFDQTGGGNVTFSGDVTSGSAGTDGGNITLTSADELTINAGFTVSSQNDAGGSGTLTIDGATVNGTVDVGAGDIVLQAAGSVTTTIGGAITSGSTINLTAREDIIVGAAVTTTSGDVNIEADTGAGLLALNGSGGTRILAAGSVNSAGSVLITGSDLVADDGGSSVESVQIDADAVAGTDQVTAANAVTIRSNVLAIEGVDAPAAADIIINGNVTTTGTAAADNVVITANQDITFGADGDITASGGDVTVTADNATVGNTGGTITMFDGAVITANTSGDISLTADGDISLGQLTGTAAAEILTTSGSVIDNTALDDAGNENITATTLAIQAATGVGNFVWSVAADETLDIDIQVTTAAITTTSGDLFLSDTGGLELGSVSLGAGTLAGATITGGSVGADILIRESGIGTFTVSEAVSNTGGGHAAVVAHGQTATDTLEVNADITSNADDLTTSGDVRLVSESDLNIAAGVTIDTKGGDALLAAGFTPQYSGAIVIGDTNADLTMADTSRLSTVGSAGNVLLTATNDVLLSVVNAGTVADGATVFVVADNGTPDGLGQILDNETTGDTDAESEAINITAANVSMTAGDGIGIDVLASRDNTELSDIDTSVGTLAARTDSGSIFVRNINSTVAGLNIGTVAGVPFTVAGTMAVTPANVSGITINDDINAGGATADSGLDAIAVRAVSNGSTNGAITVDDAITNNDAGNVTVSAEGVTAPDDLSIDANISSTGTSAVAVDSTTGGNIRLFAGDTISVGTTDARTISTAGSGEIHVFGGSNRFSNLGGSNAGDVTMFDGSGLSSTSGNITVLSANNVDVSRISTTGNAAIRADSRVTINGAAAVSNFNVDGDGTIADVLTGDGAGNENMTAAELQMTAATGIGTDMNAIDTDINGVVASTQSGDISIHNQGNLAVLATETILFSPASGLSIGSATAGVAITDSGSGQATPDSGTDNISLVAEGGLANPGAISNDDGGNIVLSANNNGTLDGDVFVFADVTVTGGDTVADLDGNISISAENAAVVFGVTVSTDDIASASDAGSIEISGGLEVVLLPTSTIQSDEGSITIVGGGSVTPAPSDDVAGILVIGSEITSDGGSVSLTGIGGDDTGGSNEGIEIVGPAGNIETTSGTITLMGTGGAGNGSEGIRLAGGTIESATGNISLTGIGGTTGDENSGIDIDAATIESTGTATITLDGTGAATSGSGADGIEIQDGATLESADGDISLTGRGGADGTNNDGIDVEDGSTIESTGAAAITLLGSATSTGAGSDGVDITDSTVRSSTTAIQITGTSVVDEGVELTDDALVTSADGNIRIDGTGGTGGDAGIKISSDALVSSTGMGPSAGTITLAGIGGGAIDGVRIGSTSPSAGSVTSVDGAILIEGTAGTGDAIRLVDTGVATTSNITGTGNATITLDGTGSILMDDGTTVTAANASLIDIMATQDITISAISTVGGEVQIASITGAIIDGGDIDVDITALDVVLRAVTGIGSAGALDTTVTNLAFINATSGDVNINNTGDLNVATVDLLTSSSNAGGDIDLTTTGTVTFEVNTTASENIVVNATESATADAENIVVNGGVIVESTGANITFNAGDRITINDTASVTANSTGSQNISLNTAVADLDGDGLMTLNGDVLAGTASGIVTLNLNAAINGAAQAVSGMIVSDELVLLSTGTGGSFDLDQSATNDVREIAASTSGAIALRNSTALEVGSVGATAGITTTNDDVTLCATTLTLATSIAIGSGTLRLSATPGAINQTSGSVTAQNLGVRAGTDISLTSAGNNVDTFAATTSGGNIAFNEADGFAVGTVTNGDCFVQVVGVNNTSLPGTVTLNTAGTLQVDDIITTINGLIDVDVTVGNMNSDAAISSTGGAIDINVASGSFTTTVNGPVSTVSGGITIDAATTLTNNATITSGSGDLDLTGGNVVQNANITTAVAGTVDVTADAGDITMADGTSTTSSTGEINYDATGNVVLSEVASASGDIIITADSDTSGAGAITDGTTSDTGTVNLSTAGMATLTAATGIGATGAADIDTSLGSLQATNSTGGDIVIRETDGLVIAANGIQTTGGNGSIDVDVDAGDLTINPVAPVSANGSGDVTLNVDAGNLESNSDISSDTGNIDLTADSVTQNADIMTTAAGMIDVIADNGGITMVDGTTSSTVNGAIGYDATTDVAISILSSTNSTVDVTATSGSITDNLNGEGPGNENVLGTTANLTAAGNIGGLNDIDTAVDTLNADSTVAGSIDVAETDAINLASVSTQNGPINVVAGGQITATSVSSLTDADPNDISLISTGAGIEVIEVNAGSAGDVILDAQVGDITNSGADPDLIADDLNATATGSITLDTTVASVTAASTASGNISLNETDAVELTNVTTNDGSIDVTAGSDIVATSVDANGGAGDNVALTATLGNITGTSVAAADSVTMDAIAGNVIATSVTADTGNIDIDAQVDVTATQVTATAGNIDITADTGDILVDTITANGASPTVAITATVGSVLDSNNDNAVNISAANANVIIVAGTDIGEAGTDVLKGLATNPLELDSAMMSLTATGIIAVHQTSSTSVTTLDAGAAGTIFLSSDADIDLSTSTPTAENLALLTSTGTITLPPTINMVSGDLRIDGNDVAAAGGTIDLNATRILFKSGMSEEINITAQRFDGETDGDLTINSDSALVLTDLDCDLTSIDVGSNIAVINSTVAATVSQELPADGSQNSRVLAGSLVLNGLGTFELTNVDNDTNVLAGNNTGSIAFRDIDDVTIDTVVTPVSGSINGLSSGGNNILLDIGTTLDINQQLNAAAEVRIQSNGDIVQSSTGIITATSLGVHQQAAAGVVQLAAQNDTDILAVQNDAAGGAITFADSDDLMIGSVSADNVADASFGGVTGIVSNNGNVTLDAGSALVLTQQVDSGTADVRLIADGNITQTADGVITSDELGVRQESAAGSIILDDNNAVNELAAFNDAPAGTIGFRNTQDLAIGEVDSVSVAAAPNATAVDFVTTTGVETNGGDIVLDIAGTTPGSGSLTINRQLDAHGSAAAPANIGIITNGAITQSADGVITAAQLAIRQTNSAADTDISLGAASNDVNTLAVDNNSETTNPLTSGDVTFFDADDLTIDTVGEIVVGNLTSAMLEQINTSAGDINITADGFLTVNKDINAAHDSLSTSINESITLISRNGDFTLADGTTISTDEDPSPGMFDDVTGDELTIIAGSSGSNGTVSLGNDIEIRTDGGVAKQIAPRPTGFAAAPTTGVENAFVTLSDAENMRANLQFTTGAFLGQLNLVFGVIGEENLEVVFDWGAISQTSLTDGGPAGDATPSGVFTGFEFGLSDADKSIFFIDQGGAEYLIPHFYQPEDLVTTNADRNGRQVNPGIFGVRFSVAQHSSINVWGNSAPDPANPGNIDTPPAFASAAPVDTVIDANGNAIVLPAAGLALLSSTDTNPLHAFEQEATQLPLDFVVPTSTGIPEGFAEWEFISGPSPGLVVVEPTPLPEFVPPLVETPADAPNSSAISESISFGSGAASDAAIGTEVYLQIRRYFELDTDAEIVIQRITDNSFISNRENFEQFVLDNPVIQDGSGYEVWLITETGGQEVARPIVKFEVTGGRPGPATEELPETFEPYKLNELNFEQPNENAPDESTDMSALGLPVRESPQVDASANDNGSSNDQKSVATKTTIRTEHPYDEVSEMDADANIAAGTLVLPLIGFTKAARWRRRQEESQNSLGRSGRTARRMERLGRDED